MSVHFLLALVLLAAFGLTIGGLVAARGRRRSEALSLERLGFRACPEDQATVLETVASVEHNKEYRIEVRDLKKLEGTSPVYIYAKHSTRGGVDDPAHAEEEILFRLRRPVPAPVVFVVKPSALAPGIATRLLGKLATAAFDMQADDLARLEIPADLANTNLIGALGPRGALLHDVVDARTLAAVLPLGDAGALLVRLRDGWCSIASGGRRQPFRMDRLVSAIRPLLA